MELFVDMGINVLVPNKIIAIEIPYLFRTKTKKHLDFHRKCLIISAP